MAAEVCCSSPPSLALYEEHDMNARKQRTRRYEMDTRSTPHRPGTWGCRSEFGPSQLGHQWFLHMTFLTGFLIETFRAWALLCCGCNTFSSQDHAAAGIAAAGTATVFAGCLNGAPGDVNGLSHFELAMPTSSRGAQRKMTLGTRSMWLNRKVEGRQPLAEVEVDFFFWCGCLTAPHHNTTTNWRVHVRNATRKPQARTQELALWCSSYLDESITWVGPGQYPQYTRAWLSRDAVGSS